MILSKIKNAMLHQKRARMSYVLNSILVYILSFLAINIFTSVYVNIYPGVVIKQPVSRSDDFGFLISNFYGFIYSSIVIASYVILMFFCIQRLRDMGYRYPVVIGIVLVFLTQISDVLSAAVRMNLISIIIDIGLLIFYLMMIFTVSKPTVNNS